jgi:hypothetical protein
MQWPGSLTESDRWLSSLAVTIILAVVIVPLLTHRLAARRDRQSAKRNAAASFRAAVLSSLTGVYHLPLQWPEDITRFLETAAPVLQAAVAQFRQFLPWWQRRAFDRAWFRYRSGTGREIDLQNYHHYIGFGSNPAYKENFRRNVDALLSFAS